MSESKSASGHCLCGAVTVTAENCSNSVHACHCSTCRRWSGGPTLSFHCGTAVNFTGREHIRTFDSSEWARRGFCAQCGSHLFYQLKDTGAYTLAAGLFDKTVEFRLNEQYFIEQKPVWYTFSNTTENLTGAELFAKYAPPDSAP